MIEIHEVGNGSRVSYEAHELIGENYDSDRNAFYGKVGNGPETFYVITYVCIAQLDNLESTWDGCARVIIGYWVDLTITAQEK